MDQSGNHLHFQPKFLYSIPAEMENFQQSENSPVPICVSNGDSLRVPLSLLMLSHPISPQYTHSTGGQIYLQLCVETTNQTGG